MKTTHMQVFCAALLLALMAGCASEPTVGDLISRHGKDYEDIGRQWNKGNDMLTRGQAMVKEGKQQIEDGKENVEDGEELIVKGQRLIDESEKRFANNKPRN